MEIVLRHARNVQEKIAKTVMNAHCMHTDLKMEFVVVIWIGKITVFVLYILAPVLRNVKKDLAQDPQALIA